MSSGHCQRLAAILFWKQIQTQISSECRYEQQGRFTGRTEWADVHTATDRLKKIDQILKTELLYIFAPRTGNWQSRLNLTVFQWFYHDNPRLDFRRLPGPIFDPPRGMRAGSFSRTAAGNRAYDTGGRGGGGTRATIILPHAKLKKKKKRFSYLNLLITFMMYGQKNYLKFWAGKLAKSANYPGSHFQKLEWKLCSYKLRIMPRNFSHRLFPFFSSAMFLCSVFGFVLFVCLFSNLSSPTSF